MVWALSGIRFMLKAGREGNVPRVYGLPATYWGRFCTSYEDGNRGRNWPLPLSQLDT
jgi:hypothetical protein